MRALIATTGSEGDVRPFFPLARELAARGHEVLFSAPEPFAASAAEQGLAFRKIGPPWVAADIENVFARVLNAANPLAGLSVVMDFIAEQGRPVVPELLEMASQADVVIHPPILVPAAAAARARDVREVTVQFAPVFRASGYSPTGADLGPLLNSIAWSLGARMLSRATDTKLNTLVEAAGLPPWKDVLVTAVSPTLDLVAVSPHVLPRDPAWPASSHVTGYFFSEARAFVPDPALEQFLAGERPVVIGFGSMLGFDPEATTRTLLEAARGLSRKVLIQSGWAGLHAANVPPNVRFIKFIPHDWLFARAACVVHHGGAGTTAAVVRAGIPQAIVWHLGDQPVWGTRTRKLGVSPGFISYKKLTASWLRYMIERMCGDAVMKAAARTLGEAVRAEDGVRTAADLIEDARSA
jgi:UDP:flavonoid glycosyltransferase YjiC (YdhE family)